MLTLHLTQNKQKTWVHANAQQVGITGSAERNQLCHFIYVSFTFTQLYLWHSYKLETEMTH